MSRRRTAILDATTGITTLAAVLALIVRWHTGPVVNRANYDRVLRGMLRTDVEALFGDLTLRIPETVKVHSEEVDFHSVASGSWWCDGRHEIVVQYDGLGLVVGKSYSRNADAPLLTRFVDWLGW